MHRRSPISYDPLNAFHSCSTGDYNVNNESICLIVVETCPLWYISQPPQFRIIAVEMFHSVHLHVRTSPNVPQLLLVVSFVTEFRVCIYVYLSCCFSIAILFAQPMRLLHISGYKLLNNLYTSNPTKCFRIH